MLSHCTIYVPPPTSWRPTSCSLPLFSTCPRLAPLVVVGRICRRPAAAAAAAAVVVAAPPPLTAPATSLLRSFLFGGRSATPSSLSPSPSLSLPYLSHPHRHRHKHDAVCSVVRSQRRVDDSAAVAPKQYGSNLERKNFARGACIHVLAYTTKGTTYMTCTRTHAHARSVEAVCRVALLVCS